MRTPQNFRTSAEDHTVASRVEMFVLWKEATVLPVEAWMSPSVFQCPAVSCACPLSKVLKHVDRVDYGKEMELHVQTIISPPLSVCGEPRSANDSVDSQTGPSSTHVTPLF